ncbi:hypothetical protein AQJ11_16675 [Streptomyces corchorusii]|uniref:Uncharacterized protein n=1 Tax=Streptomyces corchorusii TaxID=1903 RepID=A0A101QBS5_STRCK|nr:hypothetical protein AQJ11_16675 [Streptomyces corchorusii]
MACSTFGRELQLQSRVVSFGQVDQALAYRRQSSPDHTSIRLSLSSDERHVPENPLATHKADACLAEVSVSTTVKRSVRAVAVNSAVVRRSGLRAGETCVIVNLR